MPAATKLRGYQGKVYYTPDGGARIVLAHLSSVDIDVKADSIDASDHDTNGWKDKMSGMKEFSGTAKVLYFTNDASQEAIEDALSNDTDLLVDFRPLDVTGEKSYTGTISITGYKLSAGNSDAQARDITFDGRSPLVRGTITTGGE